MTHLFFVLLFSQQPGPALPAVPEDACRLEGFVELQRPVDGGTPERIDPAGMVVFVDTFADRDTPPLRSPRLHRVTQRNQQFHPEVLAVQLFDRVMFVNEDGNLRHDVFSNARHDTFYELANEKNVTGFHAFNEPGASLVQCNIHKTMRLDVMVVEHEVFTVTDAIGRFSLPALPSNGTYFVTAWERNGGTKRARVKSCVGRTSVKFTVKQLPPPKLLRRDYTEYEGPY